MSSVSSEQWNPYINNGGTVVAAACGRFAVVAADTRLSVGYAIHSRKVSKLLKLTDTCVLGSSGMQADILALGSALERQVQIYRFTHHKEPSINAIAQLLSTILYSRRFFPYYTFNVLTGLNEEGQGVVCGFDAVGNYGFETYAATGTSSTLILSVLDNQLAGKNQLIKPQVYTLEELVNVVKGALVAAVERDIYTGDSAEIVVFDKVAADPIVMRVRTD